MSTTTPPRVLLADDHTLVLEGFRRIVEQRCEVVGAVEDGRALLEAAVRLRPDIILLDISMPLLNGVDAGRQIKKLLPDVKLIFVTMHADPAYVSEAFKAGASAYLLKRSAARELDQAIEAVLKGQYFVTSLLTREIVTGLSSEEGGMFSQRQDLTPRQREVLQHCRRADHQRNRGTLEHLSQNRGVPQGPNHFPSQSAHDRRADQICARTRAHLRLAPAFSRFCVTRTVPRFSPVPRTLLRST